jgi:uncharacterized protein YjbI with pentapeptide repeats
MLKHRAAWGRWLAGIAAAVVLVLAVAWVLFVPAADWLAHHDIGSAHGALLQTARDDARGRLLTLGAGLLAAAALLFTARNFTLSRRTFELTEQGQVTDRYTKAITQLGDEKLDVRIGGIYALERVVRDSARDHPTIMEVLTAFIREHSRDPRPEPDPGSRRQKRSIRPDVQAAATVIARRHAKRDVQHIDLSHTEIADANLASANLAAANLTDASLNGADLTGAYLRGANLRGAYLLRADLTDADLTAATLTDAHFTGADLSGATLADTILIRADLSGATLTRAYLRRAYLHGANLTGATLTGTTLINADLDGADLTDAKLNGADLGGADLTGADLTGADLDGADLTDTTLIRADLSGADLSGAYLTGARWPEDAPVPPRWERDPGSGRLEAASTDSGPGEAD